MKFIGTHENIAHGLQQVAPLAGRNAQLPILNSVLLETRDGMLHLTTTDLEIGVHVAVPGKAEVEGKCAIPARTLSEYVQNLPSGHPVTLELKGSQLTAATEHFSAQFTTASAEDFPLLPQVEGAVTLTVPAQDLHDAVAAVLFAAARDATRPEIHSVLVRSVEGKVVVAATDSFRLAEVQGELAQRGVKSKEGDVDFEFLLPLTAAHEVVRLLGGSDAIEIVVHDTHIRFSTPTIELSSRLVDGHYPDYQQIIPQETDVEVQVDRDELVRALKSLVVLLPRDSRRVQFSLNPDKGVIGLSVAGSEQGQGEVEVAVQGSGEARDLLLNIQYVLEGVQAVATETLTLACSGSSSPVLLRPHTKKDKEEGAYTYVVMPIQAD